MLQSSRIPDRQRSDIHWKVLAALTLGNLLEWFDFALFALFAVQIAAAFYPPGSPITSVLAALMTMGIGFLARPIGAIVLGRYADLHGRKAALMLTIGLMAVGTLLIAICPPYASIGYGAVMILVVARIIQGISAGGEIGGALALLVETAPVRRRGFYAAFQQVAQAGSFLLCGLSAWLLSVQLTPEQMNIWGWRVPFFMGLLIAPLGWYLRKQLTEQDAGMTRRASRPVAGLKLARYTEHVVLGGLVVMLWTVSTQIVNYMPTYAWLALKIPQSDAYAGILLVGLITLACPLAGWLSDRHGAYRIMSLGGIGMTVFVYLALGWLKEHPSGTGLILLQGGMAVAMVFYTGPACMALAELFPQAIRSRGIALSYTLSVTVFGSSTPALITLYLRQTGDVLAIAHYIGLATLVSTATLWRLYHRGSARVAYG